jgi:lysophospholipid acyltransferase (LPLAT)-like uncharacterized protein
VALLAPPVVFALRALWATYRFRIEGEDEVRRLVAEGRPLILSCWHETVFVMTWYAMRLVNMGAKVVFLVSPSRDGDLVVRMLDVIGATVVRGSATRSGVKALHRLFRSIRRDGGSPLMACDGPHGPRHHCKAGSVVLGSLSGEHILPMGCWARRAIRLRTWDRLLVPLPWTAVSLVLGRPYTVSRGLEGEAIEIERRELQDRLGELTEQARSGITERREIPD